MLSHKNHLDERLAGTLAHTHTLLKMDFNKNKQKEKIASMQQCSEKLSTTHSIFHLIIINIAERTSSQTHMWIHSRTAEKLIFDLKLSQFFSF